MLSVLLLLLLAGYLPGAMIFRLPIADRDRRAALPIEERVFWHVTISAAWSLTVVLILAALERYRFERLLLINGGLCVMAAVSGHVRLRYRGQAPSVTWTAALPVILIALGVWRFFPASEYIIGGKDPGTYVNEGIQIAQRGTLTIHDPVVAAVPEYARDLFFPSYHVTEYYSVRFMGFYLRDAQGVDVNGQFPQLFPASMAVGYGVYGLTGARLATGVWGILGLLAVYFMGARLVGKAAAFSAAALLALNVVEVWFARYPNSELVMQVLLFGALLSFARAHQDNDRFFGPVAGVLIGLVLFTRIEGVPVIAGMIAAGLLVWLVERRAICAGFLTALVPWMVAAGLYYTGPIYPYTKRAFLYLHNLPVLGVAAAGTGLAIIFAILLLMRRRFADRAKRVLPLSIVAVVVMAALYAAFFREPGGRLAPHDAYALRNFTTLYLLWPGLAAAVIGFAVVVRRDFWRDPAFVLVFSGLSLFFFYKIQIVPIEFWAARRHLPVILPGALLFAAAAGLGRGAGWPRRAAGVALVAVLGYQYTVRAAPVMPHVEYAGMIPALERLAARFTDRDLVLVEARNAGADTHVLAVPLAYIYARDVLVLNSARPDKIQLRAFLEDMRKKYQHVYFVGGGGTDLLSRHIGARAVADEKIKVPEFESTQDRLPSAILRKDFDYSVYELTLDEPATHPFSLDIGTRDDLSVLRFLAKETNGTDGRTFRWTRERSLVAIPGMDGTEREVVLVMHDGGRPPQAPQAHVDVQLNGVSLGGTDVSPGFREYRFVIPSGVAAQAAGVEDPAQLTLVSNVWTPRDLLGGTDDRKLGVMVDRVDVR